MRQSLYNSIKDAIENHNTEFFFRLVGTRVLYRYNHERPLGHIQGYKFDSKYNMSVCMKFDDCSTKWVKAISLEIVT